MISSQKITKLNEIDAISLKQKLDLQEVILLDVRESGEYATEHIVGSIFPLPEDTRYIGR